MSMSVLPACMTVPDSPWRPEEGIGFPGTRIAEGMGLHVSAGN